MYVLYLQMLLTERVNADILNSNGATPLHMTRDPSIIQVLLIQCSQHHSLMHMCIYYTSDVNGRPIYIHAGSKIHICT